MFSISGEEKRPTLVNRRRDNSQAMENTGQAVVTKLSYKRYEQGF